MKKHQHYTPGEEKMSQFIIFGFLGFVGLGFLALPWYSILSTYATGESEMWTFIMGFLFAVVTVISDLIYVFARAGTPSNADSVFSTMTIYTVLYWVMIPLAILVDHLRTRSST